jgi:hypothetical protein
MLYGSSQHHNVKGSGVLNLATAQVGGERLVQAAAWVGAWLQENQAMLRFWGATLAESGCVERFSCGVL